MYFLCRLIPPRPGFIADMTPDEAEMMKQHGAYWRELLARGAAIVFGPVLDPKGPWGVGIVSVSDQEELGKLQANDPAIRARIGLSYEAFVMPQLVYASR